jgi:hypothetical protein
MLIRAFLIGSIVSGVLTYLITDKTYQWPEYAPDTLVKIELNRGQPFVGHFVEFVDLMELIEETK